LSAARRKNYRERKETMYRFEGGMSSPSRGTRGSVLLWRFENLGRGLLPPGASKKMVAHTMGKAREN